MEKNYRPNLDMYAVDTDADHILHRIGSDDYTAIRHIMAKDPDAWEEISEAEATSRTAARTAEAAYKSRIIALIRQRYDQDDETAILRQRDTKPDEFATYNAFAEQCKARARAEVEVRAVSVPSSEVIDRSDVSTY